MYDLHTEEILDLASTIFVALDKQGVVKMINKKGCEVLGYKKEEIEDRHWFAFFVPKEEREKDYCHFKSLMEKEEYTTEDSLVLTKDEKLQLITWKHLYIKDKNGALEGMLLSGENISERKALQERLTMLEKEKRKLMIAAVMEAQEKERLHIASELHDNVGQILTTCKLLLEGEMQKENNSPGLNNTYRHLQNAINEVRSLSHQLNPAQLNEIGLMNSLQEIVKNVSLASGMTVQLKIDDRKDLALIPPDVSLAIFRIVQEQLNNILRHAEAKQVTLQLAYTEKEVELEITDDGKGFIHTLSNKGLGLKNIYNRAELFNGKVVIHSSPGEGCILSVYIPLLD